MQGEGNHYFAIIEGKDVRGHFKGTKEGAARKIASQLLRDFKGGNKTITFEMQKFSNTSKGCAYKPGEIYKLKGTKTLRPEKEWVEREINGVKIVNKFDTNVEFVAL